MSNRKRTSRSASNQKPKGTPNAAQRSSGRSDDDAADATDAADTSGDEGASAESTDADAASDDQPTPSTAQRRERSSAARSSNSSTARRSSGSTNRRPSDDADEGAGPRRSGSRSASERSERSSTARSESGKRPPAKRAASGGSRSAAERSTRSNNGRRAADRGEADSPRLPAADRDERRSPRSAKARGPEDAPTRQRRARAESNDTPSGGQRRAARPEPSTNGRSASVQREFGGGFDVMTIEPDQSSGRHRPLEALWFELAGAWGADGIGPVALVAVPEMTAEDAAHFALRLAEVGAEIGGRSIRLIIALDIGPSDAELLAEMATGSELTMLVVQSPTADPAAIPLLRRCTSVVPVVQLGSSLEDEIDQLVDSLGVARVPTVLAVERPAKRRRFSRKGAKRTSGSSDKTSRRSSRAEKKQKKQRAEVTA